MQPSEAIADAESAFREGDYPRCIRSVHRLFMDDLTLFEGEAARYAGCVLVSDRSRFWTAPKDLYPKTDTVESIFDTSVEVLERSHRSGTSTQQAAEHLARTRLGLEG